MMIIVTLKKYVTCNIFFYAILNIVILWTSPMLFNSFLGASLYYIYVNKL